MTYGSEPASAIEMSFSRRVLVESFQSIAHWAVRILATRVSIIFCGSGFHTGNRREVNARAGGLWLQLIPSVSSVTLKEYSPTAYRLRPSSDPTSSG